MLYDLIVQKIPIDKGWSGDRKYCALTADGTEYLLRISSVDRLERKRREYEKMSEVAQLGIPMEVMGVALAVNAITDFPATACNVSGWQLTMIDVADSLNMLDKETLRKK